MKFILLAFSIITVFGSGCTYAVAPYSVSPPNAEAIRAAGIMPVAVAPFHSAKPGMTTILCRVAGTVTVEPSFERFIEQAIIKELVSAGAYDPASPVVLSGMLEEADFASGINNSKWVLTLTLSNNRHESFTTRTTYWFPGNFLGYKACQKVAPAFGPTIQKLILDIVQDPQFRQIAGRP